LSFKKPKNSAFLAFLLDVLELKNSDAIVKIKREMNQGSRDSFEDQIRFKTDS
jgi:hypothetical protein